jgi:hypothetical protein
MTNDDIKNCIEKNLPEYSSNPCNQISEDELYDKVCEQFPTLDCESFDYILGRMITAGKVKSWTFPSGGVTKCSNLRYKMFKSQLQI